MLHPDQLNHDKYSLLRPTFKTPKGGVLTVVGWLGRSGTHKIYVMECSICKQDPELFGKGLFRSIKSNIKMGYCPCGCSKSPRWDESQYRVIAKRAVTSLGYTFLGWDGDFKGVETKCRISCPTHGGLKTAVLNSILSGHGFPSCCTEKNNEMLTHHDEKHIKEFMRTGAFIGGTKFWRSDRIASNGGRPYWKYTCPKCSHDEYVKNNLCDGVFESFIGDIKMGKLTCRCSKSYRWTASQREYQIKKELCRRENTGLSYTFIGWSNSYLNSKSKFKYLCSKHGVQTITVDNFMTGKCCYQCKGRTQQQAYINMVISGHIPVAIKIGISNSSPNRLKIQNRTNLFKMVNIGVWEFPTVQSCREAEAHCKRVFECSVLSCRELQDGWTETTSIKNLDSVVKVYENFGGVLLNLDSPMD